MEIGETIKLELFYNSPLESLLVTTKISIAPFCEWNPFCLAFYEYINIYKCGQLQCSSRSQMSKKQIVNTNNLSLLRSVKTQTNDKYVDSRVNLENNE